MAEADRVSEVGLAGPTCASAEMTTAVRAHVMLEYVAQPRNLAAWACSVCLAIERRDGLWICSTPFGPMRVAVDVVTWMGAVDFHFADGEGLHLMAVKVIPMPHGCTTVVTRRWPGSEASVRASIGRDLRVLAIRAGSSALGARPIATRPSSPVG